MLELLVNWMVVGQMIEVNIDTLLEDKVEEELFKIILSILKN